MAIRFQRSIIYGFIADYDVLFYWTANNPKKISISNTSNSKAFASKAVVDL